MSNTDKVIAVFSGAAQRLPGDVGAALLDLISPANVAITVATLVVVGVGQFFGYGEVIDIILIGAGILIAGKDAIEGVKLLAEASATTFSATSPGEIDHASELLAAAVLKLGVATVVALLTKKAVVKKTPAAAPSIVRSPTARYATYRELFAAIKGSAFKGKFQAHHLWEKRFARLIGVAEDDIISAPVLPRYHVARNGVVKSKGVPFGVPYGIIDTNYDVEISNYLTQRLGVMPENASLQQVWKAHRDIYLRHDQVDWANAIYELYVKPKGISFW